MSLDLAATGCVGMGTDETTLIERVEPSPFFCSGRPLSSKITACLSDTLPPTQSSGVLAEDQNKWRETQLPRKRMLNNLSSMLGLISETSGSGG